MASIKWHVVRVGAGILRPFGAKRTYVARGAGPQQAQWIDEPLSVGRGQPVGPLLALRLTAGALQLIH